jgi:hypothetical protein
MKKKMIEEVQDIESYEEDNASEDNGSNSPMEEEKMKQKDKEEEMREQKSKEEVKLPPLHLRTPHIGTITPQKRKVSPKKPSTKKKTHANKPQLEAILTQDDISLVRRAMEDAFEDILQRYGEKKEDLYGRIEKELKEVQQVVRLVCAVPIAPSSSQTA